MSLCEIFSCIDDYRKSYYDCAFKKENAMHNIEENNLVRFISITKKKEGIFANFKVKGIKNGTTISASLSVDIAEAEVDTADSLEKIIEVCAPIAVREFKKANFQFEGLVAV